MRHAAHAMQGKNLFGGDVGQLFAHKVDIHGIGEHEYVLLRYKRQHAVVAHLQKAASCAHEINELLGHACAAIGPEAASDAAAHNHAITVFNIHVIQLCQFWFC